MPSSTPPPTRTVRRRRKKPSTGDAVTAVGRRQRRAGGARSKLPSGTPSRLGPYRVVEILGEGGMGTVYLAEETENLRRRVAIKWIRAALVGPEALRRFDAERRALARLNHPSIAQVFEAGADEEGRPYIVMEYVAGGRITEYCARATPSPAVLLGLLLHLARGLLHAHRQGIVHRDVKPTNVLVAEDPEAGPRPKIIDFGIAKLLDSTVQLTRPGDVLGTPDYMSPEQLRGEAVDHRTDVYSFGVLIREIVTGEPKAAPGAGATASYPAGLERLVEGCTAADPEERWTDFSVVTKELEALREQHAAMAEGERDALLPAHRDVLEEIFAAGASPEVERLVTVFEEAAAQNPESLRAAVAEARRLRRAHRETARARQLLATALEEHRRGAEQRGGVLGHDALEVDGAREHFVRAAEACAQAHGMGAEFLLAQDWVLWGDALMQLGEPANAALDAPMSTPMSTAMDPVTAYREALAIDERCVAAHYGLALAALWGGGPAEEWLGAAWRVLALEPESLAGHNHLGVVLLESRRHPGVSLYGQDKLAESVAAFEKALELGGGDRVACRLVAYNLGLACLARGENERAGRSFERARQLGFGFDEDAAVAGEARPVEILPYPLA